MEQVKVKVEIDRADAIRAGKSQYGVVEVPIDPAVLTDDQRDELTSNRVLQKENKNYPSVNGYKTPLVDPTPENIAKALDEVRAVRLAKQAEQDALKAQQKREQIERNRERLVEYLSKTAEEHVSYDPRMSGWYAHIVAYFHGATDGLEDLKAKADALYREAKALAAEKTAESKRLKAEQDQQRKEKAEADKAELEAFLSEHLTDLQKEKRKSGLMADAELTNIVRDHLFAPLNHLERFKRLTKSDFLGEEWVDVVFGDRVPEGVTDDQFRQLQAVKDLMPDADVRIVEHYVDADTTDFTDDAVFRMSIFVTMDFCGRPYSRQYALN